MDSQCSTPYQSSTPYHRASPTAAPHALSAPKKPRERTVERSQHTLCDAEQGETLFNTALKVITCGLGSGILVVPWGAAGASLGLSYAMTALVLAVNCWSVMIIVHAIDHWGGTQAWDAHHRQWIGTRRLKGYRIDDFGELLRQAPPPLPAIAAVWDWTVNISNFGALMGYMIVVGDAMPPLMPGCGDLASRKAWIVLGSLACLPLCWADLAFLTYSSAMGVCANIYLFLVLLRAFSSSGTTDGVCVLGFAPGALTCMSNLVYAVVLQMCIPEYYTQLRRDDQDPGKFLLWVLVPSFTFIFILICAFATVGYLTFGPAVSSNVLLDLAPDAWGKSTQLAISVSSLTVYPNMLRPMVPPLLRSMEWLRSPRASASASAGGECERPPDIYEGRLVHTELEAPVEADPDTGLVTLSVRDTRGFEKDALIFVDGSVREYAVISEVLLDNEELPGTASPLSSLSALPMAPPHAGRLCLRPRFRSQAQRPVLDDCGRPVFALTARQLPLDTKVVLDEDPVLVTAAVAEECCLHVSFMVGIARGSWIMVGEGARAEKHRVAKTRILEPERASTEARVRTHDQVIFLEGCLRHNHGAHTRVMLDHGATERVATMIVLGVMAVTFAVGDLGFVNVVNGAISVAVIVGAVPGLCALCLHKHLEQEGATLPLAIRFRGASACLAAASVVAGVACACFTNNNTGALAGRCGLSAS